MYERYYNSMVHNMMSVPYEWPTQDNRIVVLKQRNLASAKLLGALGLATRPILLQRVRCSRRLTTQLTILMSHFSVM